MIRKIIYYKLPYNKYYVRPNGGYNDLYYVIFTLRIEWRCKSAKISNINMIKVDN